MDFHKKGSYRFSQKRRDSKRFSSVLTNKNKCIQMKIMRSSKKLGDKLDSGGWGGGGVHISSIVNETIKTKSFF